MLKTPDISLLINQLYTPAYKKMKNDTDVLYIINELRNVIL